MLLLNQVCFAVAVIGSNTVNLRDEDRVSQLALFDWPQIEFHLDKQELPNVDDVVSNMRFLSVGELCNTSFYDDSKERAVENLVQRILGDRAANRFSELKRIKPGWDFGKGEALSEGTIKNLSALLSRIDSGPTGSKLFLSRSGSLEIRWKRQDGESISVFAKEDGFDVLLAEDDVERSFSDSDFEGVLSVADIRHAFAA